MSGLPETFPCPWCGMSYPAKPVLVGKAVRCKGCRNGFVLQADGAAARIQEVPSTSFSVSAVSAAATPPSPPVVAAAQPTSAKTPPTPAVAAEADMVIVTEPEAVKRAPALPAARASERIPKRNAEHLAAARAQMAAQLAEVAQKAANSEVVKREERKSERLVKATAAVAPAGDSARTSRVVLTGEGEKHHREMRLVWMALGVIAAVVLLLLFVLSLRSTTRAALDAFAAPVASEQNRYPLMGDTMRARAWLASARSMPGGPALATDLADATFGAERTIVLEPLRAQIAVLKGLRLDPALGIWLAPADLVKARNVIAERTGADAIKAVAGAKLRHVVHSELVKKWGLSEDDTLVLSDLLTATAPRDGEPIMQRILDLGELPDALVLRPFSGRRGSLLIDNGRPPYKPVQGPYTGTIMRIEGARWPIGWRVLHLNQVK